MKTPPLLPQFFRGVVLMSALVFAALPGLVFAPAALAQEVSSAVRAEVSESRVYVGEAFIYKITIDGASNVPAPQIPPIPGAEVRFEGGQDTSYSSVTIINGRRKENSYRGYIMQWRVVPTAAGELNFPAITVDLNGAKVSTRGIGVLVVPPSADSDVKLKLEVDNPSPYVGEPIKLRLTMGLARSVSAVSFTIPGVESRFELVSAADLTRQWRDQPLFDLLGEQTPAERGRSEFDGESFESYTAERTIIPRTAGRIVIGPATADCEVIMRPAMSIFDRPQTRRVVAPSNPLELEVRPLPTEGRPPNFNGLVGRYRISAVSSSAEVNVGDPITLEIRVEGPLPSSVPAPAIELQPSLTADFRVAPSDVPGEVKGRSKIFQRVIRALNAKVTRIPPIELPYFDTESGMYSMARSEEIPVRVRDTRVVTAADAEGMSGQESQPLALEVEDTSGGIRANYEGPELLLDHSFDLPTALASAPVGLSLALPPTLVALIAAARVVRRKSASSADGGRRKRALASSRETLDRAVRAGEPRAVASAAGAALRGYFAAKLSRAENALTSQECAELAAAHAPHTAADLKGLLSRCDTGAYGGIDAAEAERLVSEASDILRRAELEWRRRP